nr:helix-turn-helix domain-containing protein [Escherichia coli]
MTCSAVIVVSFVDAMMFALCVIDYGADYLTSQLKECRKTHMIGLRIKEERDRLSLTQQGLADAIGVAKRTFIDWEKDRTSPTAVQLSALSEIGVDVLYVVTGVRSQPVVAPYMSQEKKELMDAFDEMSPEQRRAILEVGKVFIQPKPSKLAG